MRRRDAGRRGYGRVLTIDRAVEILELSLRDYSDAGDYAARTTPILTADMVRQAEYVHRYPRRRHAQRNSEMPS